MSAVNVRRVEPTLISLEGVEEIPHSSKPTLTEEEVLRVFQQVFPGVDTMGLTRMQMLGALGRNLLRGI